MTKNTAKQSRLPEQDIFENLRSRLGCEHLDCRISIQTTHAASVYSRDGTSKFHMENWEALPGLVKGTLKMLGLFERGRRNSMDYRVERVEASFPNLPPAFDGLRVLQIADPHFDGIPDGGEKLREILSGLTFDLCVLTGDYRFLTYHDYAPPLRVLEGLLDTLKCERGVVGILGNHDFIEMTPMLEDLGVRMLINESMCFKDGADVLHIAGVDDPHYHGCHDLRKAMASIPREAFSLLLCHSPEIIEQAEAAGADYYLCGHTHAGQICLPGGIPIITNAHCPRKYTRGSWRYATMQGHTSRGTGSSGVSVRFFCPPEITLHTLRRQV